jgi:hypothetical protein
MTAPLDAFTGSVIYLNTIERIFVARLSAAVLSRRWTGWHELAGVL